MKFKCDKCGTRYTIADEKVRKKVLKIRCKICEHVMIVRDAEAVGAPEETPAPAIKKPFVEAATRVADSLAPLADLEWYAAPGGDQVGPMPFERLEAMIRSGHLTREDFVWNDAFDDWRPAGDVAGLRGLFEARERPLPPLPAARPKAEAKRDPLFPAESAGARGQKAADVPGRAERPAPPADAPRGDEAPKGVAAAGGRLQQPEPALASRTLDESLPGTGDSLDDLPDWDEGPTGTRPTPGARQEPATTNWTPGGKPAGPAKAELPKPPAARPEAPKTPAAARPEPPKPESPKPPVAARPEPPKPESPKPPVAARPELPKAEAHPATARPELPRPPAARPEPPKAEAHPATARPELPKPPAARPEPPAARPEPPKPEAPKPPPDEAPQAETASAPHPVVPAEESFDLPIHADDGPTTATPSLPPAWKEESIVLPIGELEPVPVSRPPAAIAPPAPRGRGGLAIGIALAVGAAVGLVIAFLPSHPDTPKTDDAPPSVAAAPETAAPQSVAARVPDAAVAMAPPSVAPVTAPPSVAPASVAPASVAAHAPASAADDHAKTVAKADEPPKPHVHEPATRNHETPPPAEKPAHASAFAGLQQGQSDVAVEAVGSGAEDLPDTLSQGEISAVISRNRHSLEGCYQRQLKKDASMRSARATLHFQIDHSGHATHVSIDKRFEGTVLDECLKGTVQRWQFPRFKGEPVPVEFPLIFQGAL
jgi:predicted Zn finger-like uncharacterized protein